MKVLSADQEAVPPITIEFAGQERIQLAEILYTLDWGTLGLEREALAATLYEHLSDHYGYEAHAIEGARLDV